MRSWRDQARKNLETWGEQTYLELALATVEEIGELAQAILEHEYEDGAADRIPDELADVGALGYQLYWKRVGYPDTLSDAEELPSHSDKDVIDATLKVLSIGGQVEDYTLGMREGARHVARELGVASPEFWDDKNLGPLGEDEFAAKYSTDDRGETDV